MFSLVYSCRFLVIIHISIGWWSFVKNKFGNCTWYSLKDIKVIKICIKVLLQNCFHKKGQIVFYHINIFGFKIRQYCRNKRVANKKTRSIIWFQACDLNQSEVFGSHSNSRLSNLESSLTHFKIMMSFYFSWNVFEVI